VGKFEDWYIRQKEICIEEIGEMPDSFDGFQMNNMCEAVWNHQQ